MNFFNLIRDDKNEGFEKHIPTIKIIKDHGEIKRNIIKIEIGSKVKHPNLIEHSIKWAELYAITKEEKIRYIGRQEFEPLIEEPIARFELNNEFIKDIKTLTCISYCNLHGLWIQNLDI